MRQEMPTQGKKSPEPESDKGAMKNAGGIHTALPSTADEFTLTGGGAGAAAACGWRMGPAAGGAARVEADCAELRLVASKSIWTDRRRVRGVSRLDVRAKPA